MPNNSLNGPRNRGGFYPPSSRTLQRNESDHTSTGRPSLSRSTAQFNSQLCTVLRSLDFKKKIVVFPLHFIDGRRHGIKYVT